MNKDLEDSLKSKTDEELDRFISSQSPSTHTYTFAINERQKRQLSKLSKPTLVTILTLIFTILCFLAAAIAALPIVLSWLQSLK